MLSTYHAKWRMTGVVLSINMACAFNHYCSGADVVGEDAVTQAEEMDTTV